MLMMNNNKTCVMKYLQSKNESLSKDISDKINEYWCQDASIIGAYISLAHDLIKKYRDDFPSRNSFCSCINGTDPKVMFDMVKFALFNIEDRCVVHNYFCKECDSLYSASLNVLEPRESLISCKQNIIG